MGYLPIEEMNTMKLIGMTALVTLTFTEVYANHPGSPARSGTPNSSALRLLKEQARAAAAMPEQATHRRLPSGNNRTTPPQSPSLGAIATNVLLTPQRFFSAGNVPTSARRARHDDSYQVLSTAGNDDGH